MISRPTHSRIDKKEVMEERGSQLHDVVQGELFDLLRFYLPSLAQIDCSRTSYWIKLKISVFWLIFMEKSYFARIFEQTVPLSFGKMKYSLSVWLTDRKIIQSSNFIVGTSIFMDLEFESV